MQKLDPLLTGEGMFSRQLFIRTGTLHQLRPYCCRPGFIKGVISFIFGLEHHTQISTLLFVLAYLIQNILNLRFNSFVGLELYFSLHLGKRFLTVS